MTKWDEYKKQQAEKELEISLRKGWREWENKNGYISLRRPKRFNWFAFILLTLCFNIFGLAGYLIYFAAKKSYDEKVIVI